MEIIIIIHTITFFKRFKTVPSEIMQMLWNKSIIQKAKAVISQKPKIIVIKKSQFYKKAIKRKFVVMYRYMTRTDNNKVVYHAITKMDNPIIKRYHWTFIERDKVIHSFKS